MKLKGMFGEFRYLSRLKKEGRLTAAIVSNHDAHHVMRYQLYAWLIGFPLVLNFVEMASAMKGREGFLKRINDRIFDRYIVKIVDGALPISEKLMAHYQEVAPRKPLMKLPILCDFKKFQPGENKSVDPVFLYCGAASYYELVDFVIRSYEKMDTPVKNSALQLVLGGKDHELNKVRERIYKSPLQDRIWLDTNVAHDEIPVYYASAAALLIPMRPTLQDEARFPHKIGEYLAAARPVITCAYGEIKHYDFIDEETALVASDYHPDSFSKKMQYVLDKPEKSIAIGLKGRRMGLENFDYTRHAGRLNNYIAALAPQNKKVRRTTAPSSAKG